MFPRVGMGALLAFGVCALTVSPSAGAPRSGGGPSSDSTSDLRRAAAHPEPPAPYVAPTRRASPSPFASRETCEALLAKRAANRPARARIASWNIRWFPDGAARGPGKHATDLAWLACAIAALDVQVVAVQEIVQHVRGRQALLDLLDLLDARTGGRWAQDLDDCPGSGRQHVGLLWDASRVEVVKPAPVTRLNPGESACAKNLRPGFGAFVRFRNGPDLHVITVHLDSGETARDHGNRATSFARLGDVLAERRANGDSDVLVVGDLNTMGCKDCVPPIVAASELGTLDATAAATGFRRLEPDALCTHYYGKRPALLDHALAAGPDLLGARPRVEVHGACRDLGCLPLGRGKHHAALEQLSDHCPLVIDLGPTPRR